MKTIVLTGANGFIGRNCIPLLLERGYRVHAIVSGRSTPPSGTENLFWHPVNLLNKDRITDLLDTLSPTHLLHLAWYTEHGLFWESDRNIDWVIASIQLVRAFQRSGGTRVVGAGTCAEYDWKYGFCNEDVTPLRPSTLYGVSKNSLNTILANLTRRSQVSYAWGRIFFLYGPYEHENRLVPYVITSLLQDMPAACTDGEQVRDFLHVEDVAAALVKLVDSDLEGPINIASGEPVSIRSLVSRIGFLLNKSDLIRFGAKSTTQADPPLLVADVTRLRSQLRWKPKYTLDAGLQETISWWQEHFLKKEKVSS